MTATETRLSRLLAFIEDRGLSELAAEQSPYVWGVVNRICETGTDLGSYTGDGIEDTETSARVFSNPVTWAISDPRWKALIRSWEAKQ